MKKKPAPKATLSENEPFKSASYKPLGRGNLMFPEWPGLNVSKDGTAGDCLIYEDTPYNRKHIMWAKNNYNRRMGARAGRRLVHRYETRHGKPVMLIQRIV